MSHNESNLRTPTPSSRSLNPKGKPKVNNSKDPSNTFTPVNENKSTLIIPPAVKRKQSGNLSRTVKRSIKRKPSKFNERITINSGDNGSKKVNCNTLQGTSCDPPHKQDGEVSCDSMPHFKYNQENGINHDGLNNVQKEQSGGEALNDNSQESNTTVKIENTGSNENENLNEPLKKSYDEIINDYEKTSSRNIKTIHGASVLKPAELYDVDNISIGYKEIMELHNDEQMKLMEEFSQFTDVSLIHQFF